MNILLAPASSIIVQNARLQQKGFSTMATRAGQILKNTTFINEGICLVLLSILLFLTACSKTPAYSKAPVAGDEVTVDALSLKPDVPQFFNYHSGNKNVNFFVIKIDNEVLSFLDACLSCKSNLGYSFSNGRFTCKECGTEYSVSEVKNGIGTCYPIRIPGKLRDSKYYIPISELQKPS